jgi:dihydrofolate synthase/folylpolyglutamate synthase
MIRDLIDKIYKLRRFGIKPGLERIQKILEDVGNPHKQLKAIHIAGTNGKGSTASLISSMYKEAGYNVGLYTSPHIFSFNERIRIDGIPISDKELENYILKYLPFAEKYNATFFEITTAIAFEYFAKSNLDICVVETGLGGRFDATNVIEPIVSVITKIDLDHEEYLGRTIEDIVFEKSGIIKPNTKAIVSFNTEQVYERLKDLKEKESPLIFTEKVTTNKIVSMTPRSMIAEICTPTNKYKIESPLLGSHQLQNIATSILCLEQLSDIYPFSVESILKGITNVRKNSGLYARFELLRDDPPIILDVAHNPNSVINTVELLDNLFPQNRWIVIFAAMKDKNYSQMLRYLLPIADKLLLPNLEYERSEKNHILKEKTFELLSEIKHSRIEVLTFEKTKDALEYALNEQKPTLIIGSFYLLAELVLPLKAFLGWEFTPYSEQITI